MTFYQDLKKIREQLALKAEELLRYDPTVWQTGDVITAVRLNKMEEGIYGAHSLLVTYTSDGDTTTLSCTYNQVKAALQAGSRVIAQVTTELEGTVYYSFPFVTNMEESEDFYSIMFTDNIGDSSQFTAASPDAMLSYTDGGGGLG